MKKILSMLTVLSLVFSLLVTALPIVAQTDKTYSVAFNNPAIPADTGETIDLSDYSVEFSTSEITPADKISWASSEITLTDNKVTPSAKGVYKLTASADSQTKTVYLVVKAPDENEYVLYEDDFSSDTLSRYTVTGNCSIEDGKLLLNSKSGEDAYVVLPSWLADFGNYSVTSSVNIKEANNDRRWISMMYRVNGSPSPFLQMAVRQNAAASSGVELASNISNSWGYHFQGSYTSALSPSSYYTLCLNVFDNRAAVSINGTLCGESNEIKEIDRGTLGLRSNGSLAYFDYIKVAARFDTSGMPAPHVDTRDIESNITLASSMIYEIKSGADLDGILTNSPAVAIMTMDANGNILATDGNAICNISNAVQKLDSKVIPAIKLADNCDTSEAADIISKLALKDVMIVSDKTDVIKEVRAINDAVIGVYDLSSSDLSGVKLIDIRASALSSGAKICILPSGAASQKTTEFLNTLGVTVWYKAVESTEVEMFKLITSGANGIITSDRALLESVISSPVFSPNSLIRPMGIIGHRGTPALAPENTIEGSLLAAKNGANIIENDIYLTTDGVIVVMHDSTIDRTTNGTGNVESFSYQELCSYAVDCAPTKNETGFGNVSGPLPIPTLEEYFEAFKGTDTFMFIEIKSPQHQAIATALKELIDEYDIADQCGIIAFSQDAIKTIKKTIPEISYGCLCSVGTLDTIVGTVTKLGSSYNPSSDKIDPELVKELAARGIFTWPWTIRDSASFDKFFLWGVGGITTDNSYFAKDYIKRIFTEDSSYTFAAGESLAMNVIAEKYGADDSSETLSNRTYAAKNAKMIVISGNETLKYVAGNLKATKPGDATVIFKQGFTLNNGQIAYVYSEPVTVSVTGEEQQTPAPTEPSTDSTPTDSAPSDTAPEKKGCSSCVSAAAIIGTIAMFGIALTFKKETE